MTATLTATKDKVDRSRGEQRRTGTHTVHDLTEGVGVAEAAERGDTEHPGAENPEVRELISDLQSRVAHNEAILELLTMLVRGVSAVLGDSALIDAQNHPPSISG